MSTSSIALALALLVATFLSLRVLIASQRILGWVFAALVLAALVEPVVRLFSRRLPRPMAVLAVMATVIVLAGSVTYATADSVVRQARSLRREASRLTAQYEREGRYATAARDFDLQQKTRQFFDDVPQHLWGGTVQEGLQNLASRGVALLAINILTIFFLIHGPNLAGGAARLVAHPTLTTGATSAFHTTASYLRANAAMMIAAGLFTYLVARLLDLPGAAALALWLAIWDLVPLLGVIVGALPVVVLAGLRGGDSLIVLALMIAYQVFEGIFQRKVERRTVNVGPFLSLSAGIMGAQLFGLMGFVAALTAVAFAVACFDQYVRQAADA